MGHDVFSAHLVVEHVEPKLGFCLRFRMQRLSQLLDLRRCLQSHRQSPLRSLLPAPVPDQGPFAPPALPGFLTTTGLSATPKGPALSSRTTGSPDTLPGLPTGLPVLRRSPVCMHAIATTPAGPLGARVVRLPQRQRPSPKLRRVGSCITLFEACSAFYGLFPVMRCTSPIPLWNRGQAAFPQRITDCVYSDCRYAISPRLSRYDLLRAGSAESKSATAFAFLSMSISA